LIWHAAAVSLTQKQIDFTFDWTMKFGFEGKGTEIKHLKVNGCEYGFKEMIDEYGEK
jgi:hypothetical protein